MNRPEHTRLSVVICAYNEEATIADRVRNLCECDRTGAIKEIIVVDDYSKDQTVAIVEAAAQANRAVKLLRNRGKPGKWGALVTGVAAAEGEVVCVTDADVFFDPSTIEAALALFADPTVGGVTGSQKNMVTTAGKTRLVVSGYERLINCLRTVESHLDSTIKFHGQCMFFRRAAMKLDLAEEIMADDMYLALKVRRMGLRTVFCPKAFYIERGSVSLEYASLGRFYRRGRAVIDVLLRNMDVCLNATYGRFGLLCFPASLLLHIVAPVAVVGVLLCSFAWCWQNGFFWVCAGIAASVLAGRSVTILLLVQIVANLAHCLLPRQQTSRWE